MRDKFGKYIKGHHENIKPKTPMQCNQCERIFYVGSYYRTKARYCSHKCYTDSKRGKSFSEEHKKNLIKSLIGRKCSEETKRKISLSNIGKKRSQEARMKMSKAQKGRVGKNASCWKGGRRISGKGYILIYSPNHPFKTIHNAVFEHRLVIEKFLGRYLTPEETTHHLGKKDDNRPHILMAFSSHSAHIRFHKNPDNVKPEEIIFDGRLL